MFYQKINQKNNEYKSSSSHSSLIETLRLLITATSSQAKGQAFYQEITNFIANFTN
ncbi:hypothetical protein H1P_600010 [Hyella patelloides LEGE 07179]|uniref:Uncharacterized protein n=1 Tax=Hyella patelloides LEGE 07179 TaxID=945734 RepID=A0A563W139_9CYAN|nr:hypothetical protein H1P_600010 [Hyella patelloides LEGE 07179]